MTVVRVGDSLKDAESEPPTVKPTEKSLCQNCFHQKVCSTATQAAQIGALIAVCPENFPMLEEDAPQ